MEERKGDNKQASIHRCSTIATSTSILRGPGTSRGTWIPYGSDSVQKMLGFMLQVTKAICTKQIIRNQTAIQTLQTACIEPA